MSATKVPKHSIVSRYQTLSSPINQNDYFLLEKEQKIPLSETEYQIILDTLKTLRQGKSVTVVSDENYMTTQQAADFLNVSRPYLIKLLENGNIPFIMVGNRRKVLTRDVLIYKDNRDANRRQALQEFSQELVEDGLYDLDYDEVIRIINED